MGWDGQKEAVYRQLAQNAYNILKDVNKNLERIADSLEKIILEKGCKCSNKSEGDKDDGAEAKQGE